MISVVEFLEKVKRIILLVETAARDMERVFQAMGYENVRKNTKLEIRVTKPLKRFMPCCQNLTAYFIQISSGRVTRTDNDHSLTEFG